MAKSSFLDAAIEASALPTTGPKCATCNFLLGLPAAERADIEAAMARPVSSVKSSVIVGLIHERYENPPLRGSIERHRRGECRGLR